MDTDAVQKSLENRYRSCVQTAQERVYQLGDWARVYVNQYPPLAAFCFSLVILSVIPVSLYILYAAISIGATLSVAFIGFLLIVSTLLLGGAGVLVCVLGVVAAITGVGFSWLIALWMAYKGGSIFLCRATEKASILSKSLRHQAQDILGETKSMGSQLGSKIQ
jgi:hypothetical protein